MYKIRCTYFVDLHRWLYLLIWWNTKWTLWGVSVIGIGVSYSLWSTQLIELHEKFISFGCYLGTVPNTVDCFEALHCLPNDESFG